MLAKYLGAKSILTDHCADHPKHSHWIVRWLAVTVDHLAIPLLGKAYDRVTVVSEATGKFLTTHGLRQKPVVIYGGVQVRPAERISHKGIAVTFLGRMIPSKGPQLVLNAAKIITKKYPEVTFNFAGDGDILAKLRIYESDQIKFWGNLNRKQVDQFLAATDIVVLPSTHHEGLPSVILEAGAAGCAVITTDRGGISEIITNGETGLLIKPEVEAVKQSIELLLDHPELRLKLAVALQKRVNENFNWSVTAKKYTSLLDHVIL
jgi:glycosyltransferase involved in cell wall biosynthesis